MNTTNKTSDWFFDTTDQQPDPDISVGGLAVRLAAQEWREYNQQLAAVGKLIELRWREKGLSVKDLARHAHVTESSLFDLQQGVRLPNTRDVIVLMAKVIDLPAEKLLTAAGLGETTDPELTLAALQCAAQVKPPERLSPPENAALAAFMEALAGK